MRGRHCKCHSVRWTCLLKTFPQLEIMTDQQLQCGYWGNWQTVCRAGSLDHRKGPAVSPAMPPPSRLSHSLQFPSKVDFSSESKIFSESLFLLCERKPILLLLLAAPAKRKYLTTRGLCRPLTFREREREREGRNTASLIGAPSAAQIEHYFLSVRLFFSETWHFPHPFFAVSEI